VFLAALYPYTHEHPNAAVKLGRATDWKGGEGEPMLGAGRMVFLNGDKDTSILEWRPLEILLAKRMESAPPSGSA
jgi:type VI secretion system protein ImpE